MAKRRAKSTAENTKNDEAEFSRLFWAARREHVRTGTKTADDGPAHKAAVAFAETHGWQWAEQLLVASSLGSMKEYDKAISILGEVEGAVSARWQGLLPFVRGSILNAKGKHDEAIKAYRKALDDPNFDVPGVAWNNIGNALAAKGEHDEAIQAYHKALDDPNLDTPGSAWSNLGNSLRANGKHDEAIKAYRKALDDPNYDPPGSAWHYLGYVLADKGAHDEAIRAYHKALDDPEYDTRGRVWNNLGLVLVDKGEHDEAIKALYKALDDLKDDTPGYAWNNLGVALAAKGEHDEAIRAYHKALDNPKYDTPAKTWTNLAQTYIEIGEKERAKIAFERALDSPDPNGGDHARAHAGLRLLHSQMRPEALSPDDRAMVGTSASSADMDKIESRIIAAIRAADETQYDKYLKKADSPRDNTFSILRGWSSAVTLLEGSERRWRGGGYFLTWCGCGIVIDPGFDFLRNFHDTGFHGREIQAVVISHNHSDHNYDFKAIDDLRYELFKRLSATETRGRQPYLLLWDQDTNKATEFGFQKPQHQFDPVILSSGFPQPINLLEHPARIPVRVIPFKVNHGSDVPHAMGMVVELLDEEGKQVLRIGYTADTGYFPGLHKHLTECDVLLAHISQPSMDELQDASKLKEVHLGYRGTALLLGECKPKLALIGEFWAGFTDLRIPLVKGLRRRSGVDAVLPTGLGMHLKLPSLEIECTECATLTPFASIKVAPPADNFGSLAYLCPNCMIG